MTHAINFDENVCFCCDLSNPTMRLCATFKTFKCENFLWSWWPWKQSQGQNYMIIQVKALLFPFKMSIAPITLTEVKLIGLKYMFGSCSTDVSALVTKIIQTQRWHFVSLSSFKCENFCDLENKVKVRIMTCIKRYITQICIGDRKCQSIDNITHFKC